MELSRRARRLAWATIAWNVIEAIVALAAGVVAGSIALVGFGLDSTIEVLSRWWSCGSFTVWLRIVNAQRSS
jgi:divalent metal cation (Fe/Co/Zn/Cd) transporter